MNALQYQIKWFKLVVLSFGLIFSSAAMSAAINSGQYSFVGDFKMTSQEGDGCDDYFVPSHQIARMNFLGASRTIVVNMASDNGQQGPLLGLNISGLYGTGDFRAERIMMESAGRLVILMEGNVASSFIDFELTVQRFDQAGNMLCSAKGDFYGSPSL